MSESNALAIGLGIVEKHTTKVEEDVLQTIADKTTQRLRGSAA